MFIYIRLMYNAESTGDQSYGINAYITVANPVSICKVSFKINYNRPYT